MILKEIEKLITEGARACGYDDNFSVTFSDKPLLSDFQCNSCFALAKKYGKKPLDIANEIVCHIKKSDEFEIVAISPAFINITLTKEGLKKVADFMLKDQRGGLEKNEVSQKVLLDYGGANVAKSLHIGHLRTAIIGESLKRLYRLLGDEVISDVHLGDWGLQMGLTELQLFEEGKLDFYFGKSDEKRELTIDDLNEAYPHASKRKDAEEDFKKKADEWTLLIQSKKQPYYDIYKVIRAISVNEISKNYRKLGAEFELWEGESDASEYCDEAVKIIKDKGLARESEGALVVDVAKEGENIPTEKNGEKFFLNPMPPCLIQKSNGGDLYATTDIATILKRNKNYKLDRIEYVTDARQKMHFTQVFRVCKMSGISPQNQQLVHVINGTMNGKDGKPFKTRSGETVKLEDVIELLLNKAKEKLTANGNVADDETALKIGVGAMKFGDLINTVSKDYVFDIDRFLSFEGKTGPYLQYTCVRINSILSRFDEERGGEIKIYNEEMRQVILAMLKLNSSYFICYNEKSLNSLCASVYNLASAFSAFYNNHSVVNEKDLAKQNSYISLLRLIKKKMEQALYVLAIDIPKKM